MRRWYVIAVHSSRAVPTNNPHKATIPEELHELNVATFYPMRVIWRKRAGRPRERKEMPLLPGYMFIHVNLSVISARSIKSIKGVMGFLGARDPVYIRDREVEEMMAFYERGDYDETLQRALNAIKGVMVGDNLFLTDGPFEGHAMHVLDIRDKVVRGEVTIFGQKTPITVAIDKLVKTI